MKNVVIKMSLESKGMIKSLKDVEAGFNLVSGAAKSLYGALDEVMTRGAEYNNLLRNNVINIDKAVKATQGMVDKVTLMKSANMAAGFGLKMTSDEFAVITKNALAMSQAMGIDATEATEKFIKGIAVGRKALIDDLGVLVDVRQANEEYAKSIGTVASALTDQQKKLAFAQAAIKDMASKGGSLTVAASGWQQFKTEVVDTINAVSAAMEKFAPIFQKLAEAIKWMRDELSAASDAIGKRFFDESGGLNATLIKQYKQILSDPRLGVSAHVGDLNRHYKDQQFDLMSKMFDSSEGPSEEAFKARAKFLKKKEGRKGAGSRDSDRLTSEGRASYNRWMGVAVGMENRAEAMSVGGGGERDEFKERIKEHQDAMDALTPKMSAADAALERFVDRQQNLIDTTRELKAEFTDFALGALNDFATGMWDVAEAAATGEITFREAFLQMTRSLLMNLAKQATVRAIMELAEGFAALAIPGGQASAVAHFTSAALFGAVAAGTGGAGVGMTAAGVGVPDKKKRDKVDRDRGMSRPSFGRRVEDKRPINVNLYIGSPDDPTASMLMTQQIQAQLKAA